MVKKAEVETGAGTATVTRVLADRLNEGAAIGDVVSGPALNERIRQKEGLNDSKIRNPENNSNQQPQTQQAPATQIATEAHQIAHIVISQLTRIRKDDPLRDFVIAGKSLKFRGWPCHERIESQPLEIISF